MFRVVCCASTKVRRLCIFRPVCEAVEGRALTAYLAVSVFGAGVAANATAGPRADSGAIGLGDSNLSNPGIAGASYFGATSNDLTYATAAANWANAPLQKQLVLDGEASSNNNAPTGDARFGTASSQQNATIGSPIFLTIEPGPGEVAGQPVNVTLTSVVYDTGQMGNIPAQMVYAIDFGDDRNNYFGGVLDSSGPTTYVNSTRSVTLQERIGDVFDFSLVGEIQSPAMVSGDQSEDQLIISVTATLGTPGPVPSGYVTTSIPPLTTVQSVYVSRYDVTIYFSGPVENWSQQSAYEVSSGGRPLEIRLSGGTPYQVDIRMDRPLRPRQSIIVAILGIDLRDQWGREVDAASDGVAGSTGLYSGAVQKIGIHNHRDRWIRHRS